MPVRVWKKKDGKLAEATDAYFDKPYRGWWNKLLAGDLDGDGKADLLVGNLGFNSQCKASAKEPAELYYKDFDDNGAVDPILCLHSGGKSYPYVSRDELLDQISLMRTRFPDYKSYADATLKDIFTPEELKGAPGFRRITSPRRFSGVRPAASSGRPTAARSPVRPRTGGDHPGLQP
jgi:hypothetical protein